MQVGYSYSSRSYYKNCGRSRELELTKLNMFGIDYNAVVTVIVWELISIVGGNFSSHMSRL